MTKKNIFLAIILIVITLAIWYLESIKVQPVATNGIQQSISLSDAPVTPATSRVTASPSGASSPAVALAAIAAADKKAGSMPAVELAGATGFINASDSFTLSSLVGKKVILLDFWTYSCINCIRTLPYLTAWYKKYHDQGLEIVGVHTPEFEFEKNYDNVRTAVAKYGITYPVVLDSNYGTWHAYGNLYWPHEYLIDIAGYVVHDLIGEGDYDGTEAEIRKLLDERAMALGTHMGSAASSVAITPSNVQGVGSRESYFGAARNQFLANGSPSTLGTQTFQEPQTIDLNKLYLVGTWNFQNEYATNSGSAKIIFRYHSAKVFFVASAGVPGIAVKIFQDGMSVSSAAGSDVKNGEAVIGPSRLYNLVSNQDGAGEHTLELIINSPGLQAYTFTFG